METNDVVKKDVLKVLKMTDKAWLLTLKGLSKDVWFPKSVCKLVTENKKKVVIIPNWLWIKKEAEDK